MEGVFLGVTWPNTNDLAKGTEHVQTKLTTNFGPSTCSMGYGAGRQERDGILIW